MKTQYLSTLKAQLDDFGQPLRPTEIREIIQMVKEHEKDQDTMTVRILRWIRRDLELMYPICLGSDKKERMITLKIRIIEFIERLERLDNG